MRIPNLEPVAGDIGSTLDRLSGPGGQDLKSSFGCILSSIFRDPGTACTASLVTNPSPPRTYYSGTGAQGARADLLFGYLGG